MMLKTHKGKIVDGKDRPIRLNGVNVGGWLMMEAYILHAPNFPVKFLKSEFEKVHGAHQLKQLEKSFRDQFIKEKDFKAIAQIGFNCVRVPFQYNLIESSAYRYSKQGVAYLDKVLAWAQKYKIYVILDLHGACGSQNHDWHSDSDGRALLWTNKSYQKRSCALWKFLADRYSHHEWLAGYDLLNEAVLTDTRKLNTFYRNVIKAIRSVDKQHILFIEGSNWAMDVSCLDRFRDDNYALSIHAYEPLEVTFNFLTHLKYPIQSVKGTFNRAAMKKRLMKSKRVAQRHGVPLLVGEFGVNYRDGLCGEDKWLKDMLACFKELDFHWTYWTYKAVKNYAFPDGILSYYDNPPWVNRAGPRQGWNTYTELWRKYSNKMIQSWDTRNFKPNTKVLRTLKHAIN